MPVPTLRHALFAIAALLALAVPLAAGAQGAGGPNCANGIAGKRVALVIGNGNYTDLGRLDNPLNDATAMAEALDGLGFEVIAVRDGTMDDLERGLRRFGKAAVNAEAAVFFYAGHGMSMQGENYLLPLGTDIEVETDLRWEALTLSEIQRQVQFSEACVSLIILDACRDNPIGRSLRRNAAQLGRSTEIGEGLARVELNDASGMLVAYSTAPGDIALDGSGQANSPFTAALLEHIAAPNVDVRVMFGRVRQAVNTSTQGYQTPWTEDGLLGDYYLNPEAVESDFTVWREITGSEDPAAFQAFLRRFPDSVLAGAARDRLTLLKRSEPPAPPADEAAWTAIAGTEDPVAIEAFLARHPSGPYAALARARLADLVEQAAAAQAMAVQDRAAHETAEQEAAEQEAAELETAAREAAERDAAKLDMAEQETAALVLEAPAAPPAPALDTAPSGRERAVREPADTEAARAAALAKADQLPPIVLQIALHALYHYDGAIDGKIGPRSREAIAAYQATLPAEPTGRLTPEQTVALVARAAKLGDAQSQNTYGTMLARGVGVAQDYAEAALWFEKAVAVENSQAQVNLALLYKDGLGVAADRDEARRLLQAALDNGEDRARDILDELE